MSCPSCGAEINYDQRVAVLAVCEFCHSAIIYDEKAVSILGKMSAIAAPIGPLFLNATGDINKQNFKVLGRVRYAYGQGFWDEWYLEHDDGSTSWVSEDEKRLMHEKAETVDLARETILSLGPGDSFDLNGFEYSVREKDVAICEGGEGQLPFPIVSDEEVPFLDLIRSDNQTATIEVEPNGTVKFYEGKRLELKDIRLDFENPNAKPNLDFETTGSSKTRERVALNFERHASVQCYSCGGNNDNVDFSQKDIGCAHCGVSLERPPAELNCPACSGALKVFSEGAKSCNCEYCGETVGLEGSEPTALGKLKHMAEKSNKVRNIPVKLGERVTFDNISFLHVGFIRRGEDGSYFTYEYLFYNKDWGYRWLVCYDGHFMLQEKFQGVPKFTSKSWKTAALKTKLNIGGETWQIYERGLNVIDWVEGELPWVARVGDPARYNDFIKPPLLLGREITETEEEWSLYRYLNRDEVAKAFKVGEAVLPTKYGVGACEVNENAKSQFLHLALSVIFTAIAFVFLFQSIFAGRVIHTLTLDSSDYLKESRTQTFKLEKTDCNYAIECQAPVSNSWVYLALALVNEKEEVLFDTSASMSYYHGRSGGENWSEGSTQDSTMFRIDKSGTFSFLVLGEAKNKINAPTVTIRLIEGAKPVWPYILYAFFCFVIAIIFFFRMFSFENRRWSHVHAEWESD